MKTDLLRTRAVVLAAATLAIATAAGCSPAVAAPPSVASAPLAHHVYRLDFVVTTAEASKASTPSKYTINIEENQHAELRVGANIPLGNVRTDVGLKLRCQVSSMGDDLLVHNDTELSAVEDLPAIHKVSASGDAVVSPGKPTLVASLEEPVSHRRYEVTVTATKLR
jgi:hypothetical protein